jgi:hypothetical protein
MPRLFNHGARRAECPVLRSDELPTGIHSSAASAPSCARRRWRAFACTDGWRWGRGRGMWARGRRGSAGNGDGGPIRTAGEGPRMSSGHPIAAGARGAVREMGARYSCGHPRDATGRVETLDMVAAPPREPCAGRRPPAAGKGGSACFGS